MIKKLFLITLTSISILHASYYTSLDSRLSEEKVLTFEDKSTLHVTSNGVELKSFKDSSWLSNSSEIKEFREIPDDGKKYSVYNLAYVLKNIVSKKKFILKIPSGYLRVKTDLDTKEIYSPLLSRDVKTRSYSYEVEKAYDSNGKKIKIKNDDILTKYLDRNGNLVALEVMDEGVKGVKKVYSKEIAQYEQEKEKRPVFANKFDFANETLYLTYVSKDETSTKRMNISYEMKKKNTKVVLKAPISLFDPEYKGTSSSEHVGLFRDTKKALFEMKKVQIVDGGIELSWLNHPKKKVVQVQYVSNGEKDKKLLSKVSGQQFYSVEGIIYLVSWMHLSNKDNLVVTFMNGSLPFDVTMTKTSDNSYEMQKKGQTIYAYTVNKNGFVKSIDYPAYKINIMLEDAQNDTTVANKKYLENFVRQNSIHYVKD
ncbi:hypothetical protein N9A28_07350 [Sulfurimonas sp.]|nr:hypothetical protein [Sulfurimonas sp.]